MDEPYDMTDWDLEQLLDGCRPADEESPALLGLLRDFDVAYPEPSTSHLEAAHLSAILSAFRHAAFRR
jgi:hypothetical protein